MFNFNSIYKFYYEWWKNIDKTLFILITFFFSLGLFFSLVSTSLIASDKLDTNNYFFFFKHLVYIFIGMIVLIFFSSISKENLFKISFYQHVPFCLELLNKTCIRFAINRGLF